MKNFNQLINIGGGVYSLWLKFIGNLRIWNGLNFWGRRKMADKGQNWRITRWQSRRSFWISWTRKRLWRIRRRCGGNLQLSNSTLMLEGHHWKAIRMMVNLQGNHHFKTYSHTWIMQTKTFPRDGSCKITRSTQRATKPVSKVEKTCKHSIDL